MNDGDDDSDLFLAAVVLGGQRFSVSCGAPGMQGTLDQQACSVVKFFR